MAISDSLRQQVMQRAEFRCEYCKTSVRITGTPLVVEHVYPRSLGGSDSADNLAAACYRCNEFKGARIQTIDPESGQLVSLFHPRTQVWMEHFAWANGGVYVVGLTGMGRATVMALRMNNENVVNARALWVLSGWHPPA